MILSLELNGYRFFEKSILNFNADARIKRLLSNSVELDGRRVLKTMGIYGANNSGKTNISSALYFLKQVLNGKSVSFNNMLFEDPVITDFSVVFNNNDEKGWYKYEFSYNNIKAQYERECLLSCTYYAKGGIASKVLFEKDNNNKILSIHGNDYSKYLDILTSRLPFLYSIEIERGEFEPLKVYLDQLQTLANSIEIVKMYNIPIENTLETMKSGESKKKKFIIEFVKNADISINDFEYNDEVKIDFEPKNIKEEALHIFNNTIDSLKLTTTYNNKPVPSLFYDSTGTKKIEAIASYIYDALNNGKFLVIDELDNGLHFKLTRSILSIFNNLLNTKSQLLFNTHDLLLLDSNILMRKDQIYFVNRTIENAKLMCLRDFTVQTGGPRDVSEIIKHYNRGEFGKVPNPSFIDLMVGTLNE